MDKTVKQIELIFEDDSNSDAMKFMKLLGKNSSVFTQEEINSLFARNYKFEVKNWTEDAKSTTWLFCVWENMGKPFSSRAYQYNSVRISQRDGLFIAAPETHFDTKGLKKKGLGFFQIFETEIKDPIVFRYVRGGIQVLTKWGLEANDPDLVVPKLN